IFQLYTGAFGQFTAYIQRTVHLGFALTLIFMLYPARKTKMKNKIPWYDIILILLAVIVTSYWPIFYETLVQQIGTITDLQIIIGGIAILLVLEAARRAVGLPITIIAILFLLYFYCCFCHITCFRSCKNRFSVTNYNYCNFIFIICLFWTLYARKLWTSWFNNCPISRFHVFYD